jgi:regulation of enolase protein 1 (concanavalin A-like superfamily)
VGQTIKATFSLPEIKEPFEVSVRVIKNYDRFAKLIKKDQAPLYVKLTEVHFIKPSPEHIKAFKKHAMRKALEESSEFE